MATIGETAKRLEPTLDDIKKSLRAKRETLYSDTIPNTFGSAIADWIDGLLEGDALKMAVEKYSIDFERAKLNEMERLLAEAFKSGGVE